jgi:hypothetical protein
MNDRRFFIFAVLFGFIMIAAYVEAAQFESSNIKLPKEITNDNNRKADQMDETAQTATAQKDATNMSQAPIATLTSLNVEVANDVYSDKDRHVLYCPKGNYMVVRNRIFLAGPDLDKVKQVKYLLHPSFSNPVAVSEDAANSFEVWIWSWGGFPIKATVTSKSGQVFEKEFDFSFKNKFEEAQSKGIPQVMQCDE